MPQIIESRPQKEYNCTQAELYAGLDIIWDSQAEHEQEFITENTKYTAGLSITRKTAIDQARDLPDGQGRGATAEDLRLTLIELHDIVIGKWNSLDGYIKKAFKGVHYKPRIEEAGKPHYEKAYRQNWEEVILLLQNGKHFITVHETVLTNTGGMPGNFATDYDAAKVDFGNTYKAFKDAQQDAQEETDKKILANNAIYRDGREMMEDGKRIFRKNASLRDRFVWERIMELVSGGGGTPPSTDHFIFVTNQATLSPVTVDYISVTAQGGEQVNNDWGDGYENVVTMQSGIYTSVTHNYSIPNNYTMNITDLQGGQPGGVLAVGELRIIGGKIISCDIPANAGIRNLTLTDNQIVTINIPATVGLFIIKLGNNKLNVASVNGVLQYADNKGLTGGTIDLSGGTNAAPTGAGLTAKNNLIAKSWTVITN